MNILLTGATGFIGQALMIALTHAGHTVRPLSRRLGADFTQLLTVHAWRPYLANIDAVINCVGIIYQHRTQPFSTLHQHAPSALFHACAELGIARVLHISALGSDAQAESAYHRSKYAADQLLRTLDLDWLILRPALIYGRGGYSSEWLLRLARWPLLPVLGDGQQPLQPIHISDVVATVMQGLQRDELRQTLDVVGAQRFTFAQWLATLRAAQGLAPTRLLTLPYPLGLAVAHVGHYCTPLLQPDTLRMLQAGYLGDVAVLTRFLGHAPVPFHPALLFSTLATAEPAL